MKKIYSLTLTSLLLLLNGIAYGQTNIAPFATASASTCNTGACSTLNDLNFGTCGSQQMWISTGTPPSTTPGVEWLQFDWLSDVSFNSFTIHHAQTGTRFLAGALVQAWNGAGWSDVMTFANLPNTNCSNTVVLPAVITTTKLRLTSFTMSGSQLSNANFREIEIWQATAVNTPKIAPLANFLNRDNLDTLWTASPSVLVNTSSYADSSYWAITGYNATSPTGPWTPYSNPNDLIQSNTRGSWIDTIQNKVNFYYTFPQAGYYRVKLFAANKYGTSFVEKAVLVANPISKPKALFFASRRNFPVYDKTQLFDLSSGGATKWKWWLDPPCYTCGQYKNEFSFNGVKNDTVSSPYLQAVESGPYKVCLAVSNAIGSDTLCQAAYLNIIPGYQLCNGIDSVGTTSEGAVMPTQTGNLNTVQYIAGTCSQGFKIQPCADTIIVTLERLRLRNNGGNSAPGDSLYIKSSLLPGATIYRRYGGNNASNYKDSLRTFKFAGQQLYVVYQPVNPSGPSTIVNDSGFLIRWTSTAATYSKPKAAFFVPDTVYSGYKTVFQNKSTGKYPLYSWDMNNDGVYGMDNPKNGIDSVMANPTVTYNVTTSTLKTVCLKTYNCVGSDTVCKTFRILPTTIQPFADFYANRTYGLTTDTFAFTDISYNGANQWKWKFEPNNVTYLSGTDSTSQHPVLFLNTNTNYTVTLTASNAFGSSISRKANYITTISYPSPGSQFVPTSSIEDFGIRRVVLNGSIGRIDTTVSLKPVDGSAYLGMFNVSKTTLYRGGSYTVDVYRGTNPQDSMNLRVWIDYNRNAAYLDPNETIISSDRQLVVKYSKDFTVPSDASIGTSRMLVGASAGFSTISPYSSVLGVYQEHGIIIGRDLIKPTITLKGDAIARTELGKTYNDAGAIATDNIEGIISNRMTVLSNVDINHVGYYTVKYVVSDYYGNVSDTAVRIVQVEINQSGPKISLKGADTVYLEVRKSSYSDLGATAVDNLNNDITSSMITSNNLDTSNVGTYYYKYTVYDGFGFKDERVRTIIVRDLEIPTIHTRTANDTNYVVHQIRTPFDDNAYLRVDDNYWVDVIPTRISGNLDIDKAGEYTLTYMATDGSGNKSASYKLVVKVTNTIKPVITLVGSSEITLKVFEKFNDPMAVGYDYQNNKLQVEVTSDNLNLFVVGDYKRTYTVIDEFGNIVSVDRQIKVRDMDGPIISVLGDNPLSFMVNTKTKEEILQLVSSSSAISVKVSDNYDDKPTVKDNTATIPFDKPGTYLITYDASDRFGNKAQQKQRYVQVLPMTGLNKITSTTPSVSVYPNPSRGQFSISVKNVDVKKIRIYNIAGKLVSELNADKYNQTIEADLSNEADGLYFIRVESSDKVYTTKITINR